MSRLLRVAVAVVLLVGALSLRSVALPSLTFACSCIGAPAFTGEEDAVLVGTVGPRDARGVFAFAVERWFRGGSDPVVGMLGAEQPMPDGTVAFNTCGVDLHVGQHLILAAFRSDLTLTPSSCSPHTTVESPEGQALLAAAVGAFGNGVIPVAEPDPGRAHGGPTVDLALIAILGVLAAVVIVLFVVLLFIFRRRDPPAAPQP